MTRWMVVAFRRIMPRRRPDALTKTKPHAYRNTILPIFTPVQVPQEAREGPIRFDGRRITRLGGLSLVRRPPGDDMGWFCVSLGIGKSMANSYWPIEDNRLSVTTSMG